MNYLRPTSVLGQTRRFDSVVTTSAVPLNSDGVGPAKDFAKVPKSEVIHPLGVAKKRLCDVSGMALLSLILRIPHLDYPPELAVWPVR